MCYSLQIFYTSPTTSNARVSIRPRQTNANHTFLRTRARTFVFVLDIRHHLFAINPISRQIQHKRQSIGKLKGLGKVDRAPQNKQYTAPRQPYGMSMACERRGYHVPLRLSHMGDGPSLMWTSDSRKVDFAKTKSRFDASRPRLWRRRPLAAVFICRSAIRPLTASTCIPQP